MYNKLHNIPMLNTMQKQKRDMDVTRFVPNIYFPIWSHFLYGSQLPRPSIIIIGYMGELLITSIGTQKYQSTSTHLSVELIIIHDKTKKKLLYIFFNNIILYWVRFDV